MCPAKEKQAAVVAKAREVVFKFLEPLPVVAAAQIKNIDCLSVSMLFAHAMACQLLPHLRSKVSTA